MKSCLATCQDDGRGENVQGGSRERCCRKDERNRCGGPRIKLICKSCKSDASHKSEPSGTPAMCMPPAMRMPPARKVGLLLAPRDRKSLKAVDHEGLTSCDG